jgi:lipopolysaccharide export LptBFGC system permease protein LptF
MLLAEGIYLSQRFTSLLNAVIDQGASLIKIVPLLSWTAPELYLALPLVVLVSLYWSSLRSREQLEFVALASGGQSIAPLIRCATSLGILSLTLNLVLSGAINPYAKFWFRRDQEILRYDALRGGHTIGHFITFPNYTVYIFPQTQTDSEKQPVFIKQIVDNNNYRIINANRVDLIGGNQDEQITVRILGVTANEFPNLNEAWAANQTEQKSDISGVRCDGCPAGVRSLRTPVVTESFDVRGLVHFEPRGATTDEWTTSELMGLTDRKSTRLNSSHP